MSRLNEKIAAMAVLFSFGFLSLGLYTNGTFSWTNQYIPPLQKDASRTDVRVVEFAAKTNGGFVLERHGEPIPRSVVFLTAKENSGISARSFVVGRLFSRVILTPKVPRYISKSVLNL
jgi:hypothetical protein